MGLNMTEEKWGEVREGLRKAVGTSNYAIWIEPLEVRQPRRRRGDLPGGDQLPRQLRVAQLRRPDPLPAEPRRASRCSGCGSTSSPNDARGPSDGDRIAAGRGRRLHPRGAADLRPVRRRQAERAGPCRRPPRGRRRSGHLQPAVPLWRRRPRQDPPDARHRARARPARADKTRALPVGRTVHVPLHHRAAREEHVRLQADVPLRRRADGRRRPVHRRQGFDAGRILPHLQLPGRHAASRSSSPPTARRARSATSRSGSRAACNAASWSTCTRPTTSCGSASCSPSSSSTESLYPGVAIRDGRARVPRPPDHQQRAGARRRADPALRLRLARRARDHAGAGAGLPRRHPPRLGPQGLGRGDPAQGVATTTTSACPT